MEINHVPTFHEFMAPRLRAVEHEIVMRQRGRDFEREIEDYAAAQRRLSRDLWREPSPYVSPVIDADLIAMVIDHHEPPTTEEELDLLIEAAWAREGAIV